MLEADHTDTAEMMHKLRQSGIRMRQMDDEVAAAITVKELHSDRKENLLAVFIHKYLRITVGDKHRSKAEAEAYARSDPDYDTQFEELAAQLGEANKVIRKAKTEDKINDSARSLLSASKGIRNDLMG